MSQFIELPDYDAGIHREILAAVTRDDDAIVEICEDQVIAWMRGYLCGRYDCDAIFSATGANRNQLVLMMLRDIVVYRLLCIHNPQKISSIRKDLYDRAVEWMQAVRDGMPIDGAPLLPREEQKSRYAMHSNPKRTNHY